MVTRRGAGFTLIEAVVALTISSIVVVLVSTVFLVQNQYYATQTERSATHENARIMTDLLATDLRSLLDDGFMLAASKTMVLRVPLGSAAVCATAGGGGVYVHIDGGPGGIDTDDVDGFAQKAVGGAWTYSIANWSQIQVAGSMAAAQCAGNGADTVGSSQEFVSFTDLTPYSGVSPVIGDVIVLFALRGYAIQASGLVSGQLGLFRLNGNTSTVEFVTGLDSTAHFEYRTGGASYATDVVASALGAIDAVRLVAEARKPAVTGGREDVTFGWETNVYLRNRR